MFKYLGIILDSNLAFKQHVKKVSRITNFALKNFRHLRNHMSTEAAKRYFYRNIFGIPLLVWLTIFLILNTHTIPIKALGQVP